MTNIAKISDIRATLSISFCLYLGDLIYYNLYQLATAPIIQPSMVPATTPAATSPAEAWL
jgi:hypothetical protein